MIFKSYYDSSIEYELKNCPFCGGTPKIRHIGNDYTKKRQIEIKCSKCRCTITNAALRYDFKWLENISVLEWNKRV